MKTGLVGIGHWGQNYLKTIKKIPNIDLKWVYSPHRKNEKNLPLHCKLVNDYNLLLKDNKLDSIIISTPPSTHYELTKKALLAGKDVLVEKPMTLFSNEALELGKISEVESRVLMVGHIYLYNPVVLELKKMIDKGKIKDIVGFYSNLSDSKPSREDISVLWDFAPHPISLINFLMGKKPVRVNAHAEKLGLKFENIVNLTLTYPNGIKGLIHNSWIESKKERRMIIFGTKKKIIFDDLSDDKLKIYNIFTNKEKILPIYNTKSPLELQCLHFLECVEKRKKPLTDGYEGYINVRILEEAQKSLKISQEVKIDYS